MGTRQGTHGHETMYTWARDRVHMGTRLGTHGHETGYTWARDWVHTGTRSCTHETITSTYHTLWVETQKLAHYRSKTAM